MSFSLRRGVYAAFLLSLLATIAMALAALFSPGRASSQGSSNGNTGFERVFLANFTAYGFEIFTNLPPAPNAEGGLVIYAQDFFTADDINTLFVSVSGTGDSHGGARLQLACKVDGEACNPGANPVGGAPPGWITLSRHDNYNDNYVGPGFAGDGGGGAGDLHDNTVAKEWCVPFETKAGEHTVEVRMASAPAPGDPGSAGQLVFMEGVDFKVTGARIADPDGRCIATQPSTSASVAAPGASAEALDHVKK